MNNESKKDDVKEINFSGAAIVDENGNEIAITEEMLQKAFEKFINLSMLPSSLR